MLKALGNGTIWRQMSYLRQKKSPSGCSIGWSSWPTGPRGFVKPNGKAFESLVPLPEVIAASTSHSPASVKVLAQYEAMLKRLGSEFSILRETP